MIGTLAATSITAWLGAWVFRAHNTPEMRQNLDMIAAIKGNRQPDRTIRGLA